MASLNINIDRSERVVYDKTDYPVYIRKGKLSAYPGFAAESHWHDDIELILILSGEMQYNVNGDIVCLNAGEGIFVNSRQLHFGYSGKKRECEFLCVLLHPILLCSSRTVEKKYVAPILFNEHIPFYHLKGEKCWEKAILTSVQSIYDVRNDELSELKLQRIFFDIWINLCENAVSISKEQFAKNHHLSVLKNMISYINVKYRERLTLEAIAASGNVSKTGCCTIFRRYVNKTPGEYLTELRLRKAMELLRDTDMTVLEIGYAVGFSGASYFAETFRKFHSCTPSEFRKKNRKTSAF